MQERESLAKLSLLALQKRREGLVKRMPPLAETLRGSLLERYFTCGKPNCKCARGERHGPLWYLSITLGPARTTGNTVPPEQLDRVRAWIENHQRVKQYLEKISDINRELLRRERKKNKAKRGVA
jgi:hypothetical protein